MQVMQWFGRVLDDSRGADQRWEMDVPAVVREIGLGLLRAHRGEENAVPLDEFLGKWRSTVGDTFEERVSLDLLAVSTSVIIILAI